MMFLSAWASFCSRLRLHRDRIFKKEVTDTSRDGGARAEPTLENVHNLRAAKPDPLGYIRMTEATSPDLVPQA
jgi:hypothetical protein